MKASAGFIFFMLFLAGIALVNLKGLEKQSDATVESAPQIAGSAWRPTHIGDMRLEDKSEMSLLFISENQISGYSGCNRFSGKYGLKDGTLEIGPLASTRMSCPEPDNSFELSFLESLQLARSISRTEKRLTMRDDKGAIVARFVATEPAASP
jgi:heat shock protein HslJ